MPSLLMTVFVLQLAIHLINTLGAAAINNLVCRFRTSLKSDVTNNLAAMDAIQQTTHVDIKRGAGSDTPQAGSGTLEA